MQKLLRRVSKVLPPNTRQLAGVLRDQNIVALADTSLASFNAGDFIIRDAVVTALNAQFPDARMLSIPTHTPLGSRGRLILNSADHTFVSGTNIVGFEYLMRRSWMLSPWDLARLSRGFAGLGVGLFSYGASTNKIAPHFLRRVLGEEPQSVRDQNTADYLLSLGFSNVFATGCPTTWELDQQKIQSAWNGPQRDSVVFAVNTAKQSASDVSQQLAILSAGYSSVRIWQQRPQDQFPNLPSNASVIPPRLEDLDRALQGADYFGARLHAGVRAMQRGARAVILAVDNRAVEMGNTSGLPVFDDKQQGVDMARAFVERRNETPILIDRSNEIQGFWSAVEARRR